MNRPDRNRFNFNTIDEIVKHLESKQLPSFMVWVGKDYSLGDLVQDLRKIAALQETAMADKELVDRLALALLKTHHHPVPVVNPPPWVLTEWRKIASTALRVLGPDLLVGETLRKLILEPNKSAMIVDITTEDLIARLWNHAYASRGTSKLTNGAWALMLEAARKLSGYIRK